MRLVMTWVARFSVLAGVLVLAMFTVAARSTGGAGRSGWSVLATAEPRHSGSSALAAVSCVSTHACVAVGEYGRHSRGLTLAERWDGRTWTVQRTRTPKHAFEVVLSGVSCTSTRACTAVGYWFTRNRNTTDIPLVERWNGKAWTIQRTPQPARLQNDALLAVSCSSTRACVAVGYHHAHYYRNVPFAERWNGRKWMIDPVPKPPHEDALLGVSCTAANACTASGGPDPIVERWNGRKWKREAIPQTTYSDGELYGVSCVSAHACVSVGASYDFGGKREVTQAEHFDGSSGTLEPTPDTTHPANALYGVSCFSASACTAVGESWDGYPGTVAREVTLAERWNGHHWTLQPTPNPEISPGRFDGDLGGVSCPTPHTCIAVGSRPTNVRQAVRTLAERWTHS
jgi:hypothetical protein